MASDFILRSRLFFLVLLGTLFYPWSEVLRAQEVTPLPHYEIEKFGSPPEVPEGPLSEELHSAVQVAF